MGLVAVICFGCAGPPAVVSDLDTIDPEVRFIVVLAGNEGEDGTTGFGFESSGGGDSYEE